MARLTSPIWTTSIFSIFGEWSGNVRSTPTPNDCLRTVNVSRDARALALDHDALEDLDPRPRALDHAEVDADGVARLELRQALAQLALLEGLDDVAHREERPAAGRRAMLAKAALAERQHEHAAEPERAPPEADPIRRPVDEEHLADQVARAAPSPHWRESQDCDAVVAHEEVLALAGSSTCRYCVVAAALLTYGSFSRLPSM